MSDNRDDREPIEGLSEDEKEAAILERDYASSREALEERYRISEGEPWWKPGIIEVEFEEEVRPEVEVADETYVLTSLKFRDLSELNRVLQRHHLRRAEPTFNLTWEEADRLQARAKRGDQQIPSLRNTVTLYFPQDAPVLDIARELSERGEVIRASPVPKSAPPSTPPSDPLLGVDDVPVTVVINGKEFESQWYIHRCRVNEVWLKGFTGRGVVIADVDWGFRVTHNDLAGRLHPARQHNSFNGGTEVNHGNDTLHGTGVMGLAGAASNGSGMVGFAYEADLWPIQANSGTGTAAPGDPLANGILWALTTDPDTPKVILVEYQAANGRNIESQTSVHSVISTAVASGVVVCVPAGNGNVDAGENALGQPITPTGSVLVGATDYAAQGRNPRARKSNWGNSIVISAPGAPVDDTTCNINHDDDYDQSFGGTSGAAAKVAGALALMLQANNSLTPSDVRTILMQTGKGTIDTAPHKPIGKFLDCAAAVKAACGC
jgi:subtilisin family serine protease